MLPNAQRSFIKDHLKLLLTDEGLSQLALEAGKEPDLSKVSFTDMNSAQTTEKVKTKFGPLNLDEFTKEQDPEARIADGSPEDKESLLAAWRVAAEIKQWVRLWPK